MTPDLEQALRELDVDWPATPDLAAAVSTRLEPRRKIKVPGTFRLRLAAIVAAVLVGGVLAVPEARTTVFRWFGIESVEIKRGEPSATPGASLDLGTPTTIERLPVPVLQARELGTPGVYVTRAAGRLARGVARLRRADPRADVPRAGLAVHREDDRHRRRRRASAASTERPRSGSQAGHGFAYQSSPTEFGFEQQRIAGNTLLVERRDGLLLRIEGVRSRDRAVAIARSVQ